MSHSGFEPGDLEHDMYLCDINAVWANSLSEKIKTNKKCLIPGSNRRPFACEANVITNYTNETLDEVFFFLIEVNR